MSLPIASLDERTFTLRKEKNYTIPSTGLICSWTVLDTTLSSAPRLFLSDYEVKIPSTDPFRFSIEEIRNYCRGIEYPETPEETSMEVLEMTLYGYQLQAIQYYPSLKEGDFYNSIFTQEIKPIYFVFPDDAPEEIQVTERYYNRHTNINEITLDDEVNKDLETAEQVPESS